MERFLRVPEETSPHLLLGAQDQRLGAEQDELSCGSKATSGNVMRRNLKWFGHVTCLDSLAKTILHGTLEGGRRCGRQRKCWVDDIKEWTFLPLNIWLCTHVTSRPDITSMTD